MSGNESPDGAPKPGAPQKYGGVKGGALATPIGKAVAGTINGIAQQYIESDKSNGSDVLLQTTAADFLETPDEKVMYWAAVLNAVKKTMNDTFPNAGAKFRLWKQAVLAEAQGKYTAALTDMGEEMGIEDIDLDANVDDLASAVASEAETRGNAAVKALGTMLTVTGNALAAYGVDESGLAGTYNQHEQELGEPTEEGTYTTKSKAEVRLAADVLEKKLGVKVNADVLGKVEQSVAAPKKDKEGNAVVNYDGGATMLATVGATPDAVFNMLRAYGVQAARNLHRAVNTQTKALIAEAELADEATAKELLTQVEALHGGLQRYNAFFADDIAMLKIGAGVVRETALEEKAGDAAPDAVTEELEEVAAE